MAPAAALIALATLHVLPRPSTMTPVACAAAFAFDRPLRAAAAFDPGAREIVDERWRALGIGALGAGGQSDIVVRLDPALGAQAYRLRITGSRVEIAGGDADGLFYAATTLAQLPVRRPKGGWQLPCVAIEDRPAMRWRILSDDVSRGPLPTMRYFKERIRTIAAFKMNGYSPYMEHVFVSPTDPLPAPLDGITPQQLRELDAYAARFHVALIPEQQTFAHMHNTLKLEAYASAAELPHGFLLSPNDPLSSQYLARIIGQELAAVPHPPFFHIGSDETSTLGLGQTAAYVKQRGRSQTYADHINAMNALIAPSGARIMLWDDGIEADPHILDLIPRSAVVVNWHYAVEPSYERYISTIERAGFAQMIAPGASNWNEIFPNIDTALANESRFIDEGKRAQALGLFQTVWHDDGETLFEATWYPVLFAATAAWQSQTPSLAQYAADFPAAFFGVDDPRYSDDVARLGSILTRLEASPYDRTNALFWSDPFEPKVAARMAKVDLRQVRLDAEAVQTHLYDAAPPLHANAAFVMFLAARRYDALARAFQIASEVRAMYGPSLRDLYWSRYWMWELRDSYEELAPLYERAWRYEDRDSHLASNLERYHMAAQLAIRRADAIDRATYDGFVRSGALPPLDSVIAVPQP
jgi:hypothetical protein